MDKAKKLLFKYKLIIAGVVLGAIAGYLYFHFVGCNSGTCAITSKPINSTIFGALLGGLAGNIFQKPGVKNAEEDVLEKK